MQAQTHGKFFVLEGSDASGKTTQFKLLIDRFIREGYDVVTFDFPQYDQESSFFVREYLAGKYGTADDVGPYTTSIFYALDRFAAKQAIEDALSAGKIVLADRYTGSNMAHQGTKFSHPEERRGFFLWLDNLEFQMLSIPRPDFSIVLRVDAQKAIELLNKRVDQDSNKTKDIHENDTSHIERSVSVYDDLCTLFPKDFVRIDCVRNDELLKPDHIHEIVWQTLHQELTPSQKETGSVTKGSSRQTQSYSNEEHADESQHIEFENITALLSAELAASDVDSYVEGSTVDIRYDERTEEGRYRYYVPDHMSPTAKAKYIEIHDALFSNYAAMVRQLSQHLQSHNKHSEQLYPRDAARLARQILRVALPVSTTMSVEISARTEALEGLVIDLLADSLPEAHEAGETALRESRRAVDALFRHADKLEHSVEAVARRAKTKALVKGLAEEFLPAMHAPETQPVQLVNYLPRNELELIADMLYDHSTLSLKDIKNSIETWTYDEKERVFTSYRSNHGAAGNALEKALYSWDLVTSFALFHDMHAAINASGAAWQELTPRYGYEVPQVVQDADLVEQFEESFELSLKLHSLLLAEGYSEEAQYATLLGHKVRWKATYTAQQHFRMLTIQNNIASSSALTEFVNLLNEKLAEKHAIVGSILMNR